MKKKDTDPRAYSRVVFDGVKQTASRAMLRAYEKVFGTGRELMAGISGMLQKAGLPAQVIGVPPLFDIVYTAGDVSDYRATLRADVEMQRRFNRRLRAGGQRPCHRRAAAKKSDEFAPLHASSTGQAGKDGAIMPCRFES